MDVVAGSHCSINIGEGSQRGREARGGEEVTQNAKVTQGNIAESKGTEGGMVEGGRGGKEGKKRIQCWAL